MIGAIIGAVGALGGAAMQSNASDKATGASQASSNAAMMEQERQFNIAQQSLAPYQAAGQTALTSMMGMLGLQAPKMITPYGYSVQPWMTSMSPIYKQLGLGGHGNPLNIQGRSGMSKWSDPLNILPGDGSWQENTGAKPGWGMLAAGGPAKGGSDGNTFVVGEHGPEVLHMAPGSQGYVEPNSPKADMMAYGMPGYGRRAAGGPVSGEPDLGAFRGQIQAAMAAHPVNPGIQPTPGPQGTLTGGSLGTPAPSPAGSGTNAPGAPKNTAITPFTNPASISAQQLMKNDPGYQFRLKQSMLALQNSSAARGGLLSGGFGKQALQLAGGYASSEFSNAYERQYQQYTDMYNRLAAIAGIGQTSSSQLGSLGVYTGAQEGGYASAYGNAAGNNYINQGNIGGNLFNNLGQAFGSAYQNYNNKPQNPSGGYNVEDGIGP